MNRSSRKTLAQETLDILDHGAYTAPSGARVEIAAAAEAATAQTRLFTPEELAWMAEIEPTHADRATSYDVRNETTLDACTRLLAEGDGPVLVLNFASGKNPGGGFLGGSQAQEESIARSSALYPTLLGQRDYYDTNRGCGTALYTDHMILSPGVPVFRDDAGRLLERTYSVSVLTAPAPNAGAVRRNEPERVDDLLPTMRRRVAMVLAVAAQNNYRRLVLGAWGCGVFRNDPAEVAALFAEQLLDNGPYVGVFEEVVFAVLDNAEEKVIAPFMERFGAEASAQ